MALLHIALQEGFAGDAVVIDVAGREVYNREDVRTRLQIGLADSFDLDVDGESIPVEIRLPGRGLRDTITVAPPLYLGVSVEEGGFHYRRSQQPFGYL